MKKIYSLLLCAFPCFAVGQATLTPVMDMDLQSVNVEVPAKYAGSFPGVKSLMVPDGYGVRLFYAGGLVKPRFMTFDANGTLYVSDMAGNGNGRVLALPDLDNNNIADTAIVAASGFTNNHDVKFYQGDMYVTETTRVWKCEDTDQDGVYETKTVFIDNIGGGGTGGHITRTIVFDGLNQKVYVSVGSSCNVCRESDRAIIERYNIDGTNRTVIATGVRNAVGMTLHPETNRLWANNNGSDRQGNEIPPEWIDVVRAGGFYGHPFAYGSGSWFDFDAHPDYQALKPITLNDSNMVATMIQPAALIRAHSAPMAIEFLNESFPDTYENGFLTALRGSWNTTSPNDFRGYKVIYGHLTDETDTVVDYVGDFVSGFLTDSINRVYWGRPVGLAVDNENQFYISSDEANMFILQVYEKENTGLKPIRLPELSLKIYPNPNSSGQLHFESNTVVNNISVLDLSGKTLAVHNKLDAYNGILNLPHLAPGVYMLKCDCAGQVQTRKLVVGVE